MSDDDWLNCEPLQTLLDGLVADAVRRYRIEPADARKIVVETLASSKTLRHAAGRQETAEKIRRTSAFRRAASEARRRIYYHLRRYRQGDDVAAILAEISRLGPAAHEKLQRLTQTIARAHKSTSEREATLEEFHRQLFERLGEVQTVLDVGCGVYPLVFPFDGAGSGVTRYVAADASPAAVAAVQAYARARGDGRLVAVQWNLEEGWDALLRQGGCESFDAALLLKLVPVVTRRSRRLLPILAETPARTWVLSGSRTSLARRASIERRERAVLGRFVEMAGRRVRHEFVAGEEFVWIVE